MKAQKEKQAPIDFIITTSTESHDRTAANRKRVRSMAALKSWPGRRKRTIQTIGGAGGSQSRQSTFLVNPPDLKPDTSTDAPRRNRDKFILAAAPASPTSKSSSRSSSASGDSDDRASPPTEHVEPHPHRQSDGPSPESPCQCPQCLLRQRLARVTHGLSSNTQAIAPPRRKRMADGSEKPILFTGDLAMITPPPSPDLSPAPALGRADPFNCSPIPYKPWYDNILHHMLTIYAPRGWPALEITHDQGVRWEWFMTQNALADPALYYVRLLFGSGDLIRLGTLRPQIKYWLRDQAIKAINEALRDPKRALSDPMILAVGRIALHESLYGDRDAANTIHRPAHARMIQMRGGMAALDWPPLVKRLMRWGDRVMSMQGNTPRMLEDESENKNFTLEQSVDVLERWVPKEGESLRGHIKISDIVNDEDAT